MQILVVFIVLYVLSVLSVPSPSMRGWPKAGGVFVPSLASVRLPPLKSKIRRSQRGCRFAAGESTPSPGGEGRGEVVPL